MSTLPFVSIVIPVRDEERFIGPCLDSIIANDYPKERIEILVVDGMSRDRTRAIVEDSARGYSFIRLLINPKKTTPAALNTGIKSASGEIVMRMDAHCTYPPDYISGLVSWMDRTGADNVGGVCVAVPANSSAIAQAIAIAVSHPFGVGSSYFRIGSREPRWVDTVPFGCYRRELFDRIGLFDEELVRNQDDEMNARLVNRGGRILLVPNIAARYYGRESLGKLWRMFFQYGYFKPLVVRKVGRIQTFRQVVPVAFVLSLGITGLLSPLFPLLAWLFGAIVLSYAVVDVGCSTIAAFRQGLRCVLVLCAVFPVLHLSYGLGFLKGTLDLLILRRKQVGFAERTLISR